MMSKQRMQFKLKCRTSFSRSSHLMSRVEPPNKDGQRKTFAERENKKIEEIVRSNKIKAKDFFEEWEACNFNFNERKVKVLMWTGEAFKVEEFIQEASMIKSFYLNFRLQLEKDQNFSRKTPVLNLEYPIFTESPQRLKLSWDVNKCDKNRIRQMRLRKIIDCVNKVLNRQRAAKKLTLLKEFMSGLEQARLEKPLLVTNLRDETYKRSVIKDFDLLLDEVNIASDPMTVETQVLFKRISLKIQEFPISWSEDLAALEPLKINYVEMNDYKEKNPLENNEFFPLTFNVDSMKKGAYDEWGFLR